MFLKTLPIAVVVLATIVGGVVAYEYTVGLSASVRSETIPFQTLMWSVASGHSQSARLLIYNQSSLQSLWERSFCDGPSCMAPNVNFTSSMVIAVYYGTGLNLGYRTNVTSVSREGSTIYVTITDTTPTTCPELQALNYPAHVVSIPRAQDPIVFRETSILRC